MFTKKDRQFFKTHAASFFQYIPFLLLGLGVPVLLILLDVVDKKWFILAPLTWIIAIGIKAIPTLFSHFYAPGVKIKNIYAASIWEGLLSSIAELGLTIFCFYFFIEELTVHKIFSFGLGIGFAEVLFILYLLLEDIEELNDEIKTANKFVLWPQLIERVLAIGMHVFSRAVIGLAILQNRGYVFISLAVFCFAVIDGTGGYMEKSGKLENKQVLKRFYLMLLGIVLLLAFVVFFCFNTETESTTFVY